MRSIKMDNGRGASQGSEGALDPGNESVQSRIETSGLPDFPFQVGPMLIERDGFNLVITHDGFAYRGHHQTIIHLDQRILESLAAPIIAFKIQFAAELIRSTETAILSAFNLKRSSRRRGIPRVRQISQSEFSTQIDSLVEKLAELIFSYYLRCDPDRKFDHGPRFTDPLVIESLNREMKKSYALKAKILANQIGSTYFLHYMKEQPMPDLPVEPKPPSALKKLRLAVIAVFRGFFGN